MKKTTHADLVGACLTWLQLIYPSGLFYQSNTGARAIPATPTTKRRFVRFGTRGLADITGILPGKPHGIPIYVECKVGRDKQSEDQKIFETNVIGAGGIYVVARSIDDLAEGLA